jgi:hypothetical protein
MLTFAWHACSEEGEVRLEVRKIEAGNAGVLSTNHNGGACKITALSGLLEAAQWNAMPKLYINFLGRDETGGLRQVFLDRISIARQSPVDRGDRVSPYEPRPYTFLLPGSCAAMLGVMSEDYRGEGREQLFAGYHYRISLQGDKRCSSFVVPAQPGSGVTYSVSWIVDDSQVPPSEKRAPELWLTGKVQGHCPKDIGELVVRYTPKEGPPVRSELYSSVGPDGDFKMQVFKLGGMLMLGNISSGGTAWMYKKSVESTNTLSFPKDADIVFERDAMKDCAMVVSGILLENKEIGVGIYVGKGDPMPVFYMNMLRPQSVLKMDDGRYMLSFKMGVGKYWAKLHGGDDGRVLAEQEITVNAGPGFQTYTLTVEK